MPATPTLPDRHARLRRVDLPGRGRPAYDSPYISPISPCQGIVGLREVLATPETLYLVLERVHGCELFDAISAAEPAGAMAASLVRPLLSQLFAALAALQVNS
jgi:hypothetical protein